MRAESGGWRKIRMWSIARMVIATSENRDATFHVAIQGPVGEGRGKSIPFVIWFLVTVAGMPVLTVGPT